MMSRGQRIEYEILDCALNRANRDGEYSTTVALFMARLQQLFPDVETSEFRDACKGLARQDAIELAFPDAGGYRQYQGADDDAEFFGAETLLLRSAPLGQPYFRQLSALIEAPAGFKRHPGFRR